MESKNHVADDLNFLENFESLDIYIIISVLNTNQTVQNHCPFPKQYIREHLAPLSFIFIISWLVELHK